MRIAVTGASGFVGSHVLEALAARGDLEIIAVSRRAIPAERLPSSAERLMLDIGNPAATDYDRMGRPDVLIHLAWAGLPNYLSLHHFETELPAQYRFLRSLVEAGLSSLVVTGTCYEYGMVEGELSEDRPVSPTNSYGIAKADLYRQLEFLRADMPFALTWARLFYLWGPRQAKGSLFPLLCAAAERGDSSFPMSPGDQLRDYLPVEEAARLLSELALRGGGGGLVNLCSGVPVSVRALVERWLKSYGWDIALELGKLPYPAYEPRDFWGSTRKLGTLLGESATAGGALS